MSSYATRAGERPDRLRFGDLSAAARAWSVRVIGGTAG